MDMSSSKPWEMVKDREAWCCLQSMGLQLAVHDWVAEQQNSFLVMCVGFSMYSTMPSADSDRSTCSFPIWIIFISFSLIAVARISKTMLNKSGKHGPRAWCLGRVFTLHTYDWKVLLVIHNFSTMSAFFFFNIFLVAFVLICGTWAEHPGSVLAELWLSCSIVCEILVPWPGTKPASPPLQGWFLNH